MADHYTYFSGFIQDANWQKLAMGGILAGGIILLGRAASARLHTPQGIKDSIIPAPKLNTAGFFDFFVEKFVAYHDSVLGKENRHHVPFTGSIFLFVLFANLIGLVPGIPAITTTVWINVAMAFVVFGYFNYEGIKANGVIGYLKHFCGPMIFLAPLLFPIEIFGTFLRIVTLNLRLYWNITADHKVVEIFTGLLGPGVPIVFYVLGTFVCFMQAFVFTTLTMIYILLASQHEEGHEEGAHHAEKH